VFRRYVGQIEDRVEGLGGHPERVAPSPDGTGSRPGRTAASAAPSAGSSRR
jgi:hypothetical protein